MSVIFVSHSSADQAAAAEIHQWLEARGHRSVFLDFDPENGIPAGRNWEQELYMQLRACRAVIVLCSGASMQSKWVFAEVTQARALGKHIVPVKIGDCAVDPLISDRQIVDLTVDRNDGYERLWRGLVAAGIDPQDVFDWDGTRPPYPGLLAFGEEDAAIFFGRDREITVGLDLLNRVRRRRSGEYVMVLGSSGSGKSSLVRAGLVPRLRADTERWLVLDPIRPHHDPVRALAVALSHAFEQAGESREWKLIYDDLNIALGSATTRGAELLDDMAHQLLMHARREQATVLVVADQFEAFLHLPHDHPASQLMALLRHGAARSGGLITVLATMRSDFLGDFQDHPALVGLDYQTLSVGPLAADDIVQVIEKPAQLAGIDLEPGLTTLLVAESQSDDALPLLAFTLRELWEKYGADGRITIDEYRNELGGLEGAVARVADDVVASAHLDVQARRQLRKAMLAMVRLSEDAKWARRAARWEELPDGIHGVLERFVSARLLVSSSEGDGKTLEVAHEALFRSWDLLAAWLNEDAETLRLHRELQRAALSWDEAGRSDADVWRGARLARAVELAAQGDLPLSELDEAFVAASQELALAEERAREQRRARRVQIAGMMTIGALSLAAVALFFFFRAERQADLAREATAIAEAETDRAEQATAIAEAETERAEQATAAAQEEALRAERAAVLALAGQARAQAVTDPALAVAVAAEAHAASPSTATVRAVLETKLALQASGLVMTSRVHDAPVLAVAYNRDSSRLVTADRDGTALVWDATTGEQVAALEGHTDEIWGVAFGPDGHVVTGSADATAIVWDGATGDPVLTLTGHEEALRAVAYSHDGTRIATASADGTAKVWDAASGDELVTFHGHSGFVRAVAFSPTSDRIATVSFDGTAMVWDSRTGTVLATMRGHESWVLGVAFSPTGDRIATSGEDGTARVWDAASGAEVARFTGHTGPVLEVDYRPDGLAIVSAGEDRTTRIWDAVSADQLVMFGSHAGPVREAVFNDDGDRIATASFDETVSIWATTPSGALLSFGDAGHEARAAALAPDATHLATAGRDGTVGLWDMTGQAEPLRLEGHSGIVRAVAFSPDGRHLASGGQDDLVIVRDAATGQQLLTLDEHRGWVVDVAFSGSGDRIASASEDGSAIIWDASSGAVVQRLEGHTAGVSGVAFSPDGALLATAGGDGVVIVWDTQTGDSRFELTDHTAPVDAVDFSPDGTLLATAARDRSAMVWRVADWTRTLSLDAHTNWVQDVEFSPDGSTLATAGHDGIAMLWDAVSGDRLLSISGHAGAVWTVAFDPSGTHLATTSRDGTAKVWDVATDNACEVIADLVTADRLHDALGGVQPSGCTNLRP